MPFLDLAGRVSEIRERISGNLCRCTGYQGIVRSIKAVATTLPAKSGENTW